MLCQLYQQSNYTICPGLIPSVNLYTDTYRSIVVLANPKTVLNAKFAKKEVKAQVIRADQLVSFIRTVNGEDGAAASSEKEMVALAQYFLEKHRPNPTDYRRGSFCGFSVWSVFP